MNLERRKLWHKPNILLIRKRYQLSDLFYCRWMNSSPVITLAALGPRARPLPGHSRVDGLPPSHLHFIDRTSACRLCWLNQMDLLPEYWASNQIVFSKQQPRCKYKIHHRAGSLRFLSEYSSPLRKEDLKFENEFWDPL